MARSRRLARLLVLAAAFAGVMGIAITAHAGIQTPKNGCTSASRVAGELTSPAFTGFASSNQVVVDYRTWWEIESEAPGVFDLMRVEFSLDGGTTWQVAETLNASVPTDPASGSPPGHASDRPFSNQGLQVRPGWSEPRRVVLDGAGGAEDVRIRFRFDTLDTTHNGFRGWGLDDVAVSDGSGAGALTFDFEGGLPADWTATGFWRAQQNPHDLSIASGINPELVTLAANDPGTLPEAFSGSWIAWFGQPETGTYCGVEALDSRQEPPPALEPPPAEPPASEPPPPSSPPGQPPAAPPRERVASNIEIAPTLEQLDDPKPFREINIKREAGTVLVRLPRGRGRTARTSRDARPRVLRLRQAAQVPVGSIVDTSNGRILLESAADRAGRRLQRARFFGGMFQVRQPRARRPFTEMVLTGGSFGHCRSARESASWSRAEAAQRRGQGRPIRSVWGEGRGRFRTRGRYSSATVRSGKWRVEDRCNGTLTHVAGQPRAGSVAVEDLVTRRTRLLRAGQSVFVARPERR